MAHEPLFHPRVEAGGGLVEEEHARPDEQFGADGHPLALAAAQLMDGLIAHRLQPERLDGGVHQGRPLLVAQVRGQAEQGGVGQAAGHGQLRVEDVVLGHVADVVAQHGPGRGQGGAVDQHRAPVRPGDADQRLQQAGLAGAAGPEDADELARGHGQGEVVEQRPAAVAVPAEADAFQADALAAGQPLHPQAAVRVQGEAEAAGADGHGVAGSQRAVAHRAAVHPGTVQAGVVNDAQPLPPGAQERVPAAHRGFGGQGEVTVVGPADHPRGLRRQQGRAAGGGLAQLQAELARGRAQADGVAVRQGDGAVDAPAIDEHPVGGAQILDQPAAGGIGADPGVSAGDGRAGGDQVALAAVPAETEAARREPVGPVGKAGGERHQAGGLWVRGGRRGVHGRGG